MSFMDKIQEKLLPVAMKIGNQKFLVALRDSFIGTMPVLMVGSLALLLNAFLVDLPDQFGITSITKMFQWLVDINNLIFFGSLFIASLLFAFTLGNNISKIYKTDRLSGGLVSLSAFVIAISHQVTKTYSLAEGTGAAVTKALAEASDFIVDGDSLTVKIGGLLPGGQIGSNGYFTAMLIGFFATIIYCKLMNKNITIKLPDTVPPAVAKPFTTIIPAGVAIYAVAAFVHFFTLITGDQLIDFIYKVLQAPLLGLSQSYVAVILVAFITQLLWFFGIHGGNVMAPIMEGIFGVAMLANLEAFQNGEAIPYLWTSGSFGAFVWFGTVGQLIAIFLVSKNAHYREVAKLGTMPVLFNIGEPVNYGLPNVLNPIFFIPWLLTPIVMSSVAYFATVLGFVAPVTQNVTWVMPPILYGFFSTGFDWRAIVISLINIALATLIYLPFVKMGNKQELN